MSESTPIDIFYFNSPMLYETVQKSKNRYAPETEFLDRKFREYNVKNVLDVWCGTWLHLSLLKEKWYEVSGIDMNKHMISYAKEHYPRINVHMADMQDFSITESVDAIYTLCTTFAYNINNEDIVRTIQAFKKSLNKKWIVIVDVFNPIAFINSKEFNKVRIVKEPYSDFWLYCEIYHQIDQEDQKMIETRKIYDADTAKLVREDLLEYRLFFPLEMKYFRESNWFIVKEQTNSFTAYWWDDFRLITIAQLVS